MIYIYHGDNQVASRKAIPRGAVHYDLTDLTPEKIEQIKTGKDLFTNTKDVYFWSGKKLSVAQLKKFPGAQAKEFTLPKILWRFLSSRKIADLEATLKTEPVELVWYLLHRQAAKRGQTELLKKMFAIELAVKSGKTDVPLRTHLELLL